STAICVFALMMAPEPVAWSTCRERGTITLTVAPRSRQVLQATGSGAIIKAKTQIAVLEPSGDEDTASFDRFVDQVRPEDYDVIYLPGHRGDGSALTEPSSIAFLQAPAPAAIPILPPRYFTGGGAKGAVA